jgi:hypothetical protein
MPREKGLGRRAAVVLAAPADPTSANLLAKTRALQRGEAPCLERHCHDEQATPHRLGGVLAHARAGGCFRLTASAPASAALARSSYGRPQ